MTSQYVVQYGDRECQEICSVHANHNFSLKLPPPPRHPTPPRDKLVLF